MPRLFFPIAIRSLSLRFITELPWRRILVCIITLSRKYGDTRVLYIEAAAFAFCNASCEAGNAAWHVTKRYIIIYLFTIMNDERRYGSDVYALRFELRGSRPAAIRGFAGLSRRALEIVWVLRQEG